MRLAFLRASLVVAAFACAGDMARAAAARAAAAPQSEEAAIRDTLTLWYGELRKKDKGRLRNLTAPSYIEASPSYRHVDTGARKLGPRVYVSLAARALRFAWEIDHIRLDASFARVQVWERGYFFASAAQRTYETGAATTFVLERQEKDGRWLVLAHRTSSQGIPPNKVTDPLPDLRALFYATEGRHRDPAKDAAEAAANQF